MIQFDQPIFLRMAVQPFNHVQAPTSNGRIKLMSGDYSLGRLESLRNAQIHTEKHSDNWDEKLLQCIPPDRSRIEVQEYPWQQCRDTQNLRFFTSWGCRLMVLGEVFGWFCTSRGWLLKNSSQVICKGALFVLQHLCFFCWIFGIPNLVTLRNFFTRRFPPSPNRSNFLLPP